MPELWPNSNVNRLAAAAVRLFLILLWFLLAGFFLALIGFFTLARSLASNRIALRLADFLLVVFLQVALLLQVFIAFVCHGAYSSHLMITFHDYFRFEFLFPVCTV